MTTSSRDLVDARRALAEVQRDPASAARRATAVLDRATATGEARAVAQWALGRSLAERDEVPQARTLLRDAAATARRAGFEELEAHIRNSLAVVLMSSGHTQQAVRELTRAEQQLVHDAGRGRIVMQRGLLLMILGRLTEALADYDEAIPLLREAGDRLAETRTLMDRGIVLTRVGRFDDAAADFVEAGTLAAALDQELMVAGAEHNMGFLHGRRGDVPAALACLDRARAAYEALGSPARLTSALDSDRCDVLLIAGLAAEARAAAERSLEAALSGGNQMVAAEARLLLARALLALREYDAASQQATDAAVSFRRARRYAWAALADYIALQADVVAVEELTNPPPKLLARARRTAAELERRGWPTEALHVRTFVGRVALALGRVDVARAELALATGAHRHATAELRVQAWHATALLRVADGRKDAARRALSAGFRELDAHRATLGARDLRAGSGSLGADLARLGLRLALAARRAPDVLAWAERWRAASLVATRVQPSDDSELSRDLARWRHLSTQAREATLEGRATREVTSEIAHLEEAIRDRARHESGAGHRDGFHALDQKALRSRLDDAVLVAFTEVEGRLYAVRVDASRTSLHDLGPIADITDEIRFLSFAVRRLANASTPAGAARLALESLTHAGAALDARLLRPCGLPASGPVVIVPTGSLHNLLWGALPSLVGRAVTVAPSASFWLRHGDDDTPSTGPMTVGLAAGPDLHGGRREVLEVAALYDAPRCLVDAAATTDGVLDLLGSCRVVHLAAHGTFRADSPMFSSVRLHDGPLSVYELERRRLAARTIVLPACDAGLASVHIGDELLGTATALLGLGARSVVAPMAIVPDEAMIHVMVALHRGLRSGHAPAVALAAACAEARDRGERTDIATATALACIGTA